MKKIATLLLIVLVSACGGDKTEMLKQQIKAKKDAVTKMNDEIKELEKQLLQMDSSLADQFVVPVRTKTISGELFKHYIEASANVEALSEARVSPEMGGRIKNIHVLEGQFVQKGQLLITLNTDATSSAIEEVKTSLELAEKIYDKQKALWDEKIGSEIQYLQAKNAYEQAKARLKTLQAQLEMSVIRAPFAGIVDKIYQKEGELGVPGMPILEMVNLSLMKVTSEISEVYLSSINKGKQIEVSIPNLDNFSEKVPIYRVGNIINKANRTFTVEVRLSNAKNILKPNMIATVKINDFTLDSAFTVPSNIIKKDIQKNEKGDFKQFIFVAKPKDGGYVAEKVFVETGMTYNNISVITKGVSRGEKVIVEGFNTVSTGTLVKIVE